ncbi:MAG: TIR domain-containing protein [Bacteroidetes bacterium]|nr:TIR domain-containing protein [Bacteroidota bacterium]
MGHRVFISHKRENRSYKNYIQDNLGVDMIDKSLNEAIDSDDEDYIMKKIREDYLSDSTVTIFLIGLHSSEYEGEGEQVYIKRELQASLYNGKANSRNGILGIVLPDIYDRIYKGSYSCDKCMGNHNHVAINDDTVIKEFSFNYYIKPLAEGKCSWSEDDRYCVLVKWDDFKKDSDSAEEYINRAFDKRIHLIAEKVKVYPK